MNIYRDTNPRKLAELLGEVDRGETALPDFQRDFVWDAGEIAELIVSLARGFPAGSLLRIENTGSFAQRAIQGAPALTDRPRYLLLDGQQRLTSLYQAFYGVGDHEYFLELRTLTDDESSFEAALRTEKRSSRSVKTILARQYDELIMPLSELRNSAMMRFQNWIMRARYQQPTNYPDRLTPDFDRWQQRITERWIKPFDDYQFPIVTLAERVSVEAVCTIFETLNRTGVKLTPFELLTARFFVSGVNLRTLWEQALDQHPILSDYGFDSYQMLQAIVIAQGGRYAARSGVLDLKPEAINALWQPVINGCAAALTLVQEHCGVWTPLLLPGDPVIVGLAAAWARLSRRGFTWEQLERPFLRWYWNVVLADLFAKGTNTRLPKEVLELCSWIEGGALPDSLSRFRFDKTELGRLKRRDGNIYKALHTLITANQPLDPADGRPVGIQQLLGKSVGMHALLPADAFPAPGSTEEAVVNQALISSSVARKLRGKSIVDYLTARRQELGATAFQKIMDSQLISSEAASALLAADAKRFCSLRTETLYERIMYLTS